MRCTKERMADDDSQTSTLYRLVYVSLAAPGLADADMLTILNTSQSNNDERFITGFLAHNGDAFMQILEGPQEEVELIFQESSKTRAIYKFNKSLAKLQTIAPFRIGQ